MDTCSHVSPIQNNIFTPLLDVRSLGENLPALNRLVVVTKVWYHSAGANPFLPDGSWPSGWHAGHRIGWKVWDSGVPGSKLVSDSWSNSLKIDITLLTMIGDMFSCLLHATFCICLEHNLMIFTTGIFLVISLTSLKPRSHRTPRLNHVQEVMKIWWMWS